MPTIATYSLFWLFLMLLAIGNGAVRESTYGQHLSALQAHQVSTATAMIAFGIAVWLLSKWRAPESGAQALTIGGIWLVMTLCFEFLFGHYIAGHSWATLLQDYNLLSGRLWLLLLAWVMFLPYIAYRARLHAG
tara:strand:- start:690 stop:1091 length:402 start_codon:yes stop_codon:yes gene_type:complete